MTTAKGRPVSMNEMLKVLREFEVLQPGGVSLGLVAWELYQPDAWIAELIERARGEGLIELAGADSRTGEALWRLTSGGRDSITPSGGSD
ncbi:MAG: hypothetical protein QOD66_93 [Solirubrobacteraceae bacterium]|jgi:hypothetical protein|nr:hypothetical protein [Solirubrobacteraceae bacterium]